MRLSHPKHPVWLIGMMLALGVVFALQAKVFDADEIRNFIEVMAVIAVRELLAGRFSKQSSDGGQ